MKTHDGATYRTEVMERLNGIESRSRILPRLQAILMRVGFVFLLLTWLGEARGQPEAWQIVSTFDDAGWTSIHFFDSLNGLIASPSNQQYSLMRSCDGGHTWQGQIEWSQDFRPFRLLFYDRWRGYLVDYGRAGLTFDGGQNWEIVPLGGQTIQAPAYIDSLRLISTSNTETPEELNYREIHVSNDGGRTWQQTYGELVSDDAGFGRPVFSLSGTILLAAGTNTLWRSTNLGEDWQTIENTPIRHVTAMVSPSHGLFVAGGFVLGLHAALARSEDDGLTWETVWLDSATQSYGFSDVESVDSLHIWAVNDSQIVESHDGAMTWNSYVVSGIRWGINDLTFINQNRGWAVDGAFASSRVFQYQRPLSAAQPPSIPLSGDLRIAASPNPFNSTLNISYSLPTIGKASIGVYDIRGRLMHTLFSGLQLQGEHQVVFWGDNFASGLYFCRVMFGESQQQVVKIVLIK